tara:strand:+ start:129 stop:323 length:195 start_codon:yes stop_codon:yes gene_type:complete
MKKLFQKIKNLKYFFIGLRATQVLLISSQFKRDIANAKNSLNKFGKVKNFDIQVILIRACSSVG